MPNPIVQMVTGLFGPVPDAPPANIDAREAPNTCQCTHCEGHVERTDILADPAGADICSDCHSENYSQCEECDTVVENDDIHTDVRPSDGGRRTRTLCSDCSFECDGCGDRFHGSASSPDSSDASYCHDCYSERYSSCGSCGCEVASDDTRDGMCPECADSAGTLHDCSYKPRPTFRDSSRASMHPTHGCRYLGLEIETEAPRNKSVANYADTIARICESGLWYAKSDGSLDDGAEFVSHPCTIDVWRKIGFEWADRLRSKGWKAHDTTTCGIHIHISRDSLTPVEWLRVAKLFSDNDGLIRRAARRECKRYAVNKLGETNSALMRKIRRTGTDTCRYQALNFRNDHTVEIRIFRSTLRPASILRYAEFANAVCEFARVRGIADMTEIGFKVWLVSEGASRLGSDAAHSLLEWLYAGKDSECAS